MKKVILTICVAGSLLATSCKKAKEAKEATVEAATKAKEATTDTATKAAHATTETATKAVETVKSAIEGITIPEFKDPKVGEYLQSYTEYAKSYIDAKGDVTKMTALSAKGTELATKSQDIMKSLGSDTESIQKFSKVLSAISTKMAAAMQK